jgi:hypothetical protein
LWNNPATPTALYASAYNALLPKYTQMDNEQNIYFTIFEPYKI